MWHLHPAHVTTSHDVTILTSESVVCITQCLFVWRQNWPDLMNTSLNAHINTRHKGRAGQLESDFAYNQLWYEEANFRCIVCINMRPGLRVGWGRVGLKQLSPWLAPPSRALLSPVSTFLARVKCSSVRPERVLMPGAPPLALASPGVSAHWENLRHQVHTHI